MASLELDETDFEDRYDKADPIDDADLDTSMTLLNESIREQEELQEKLSRAEWSPINKDEIAKLRQQIAFNEKKQGLYIMRASKTILSILHRGFDKIKQGGRVGFCHFMALGPMALWLLPYGPMAPDSCFKNFVK